MQKTILKIVSVLCAVVMLATAVPVFAAQISDEAPPAGFKVINVTADDIAGSNTYEAIQNALNLARDYATDSNIYKVVVAPGTYTLDAALHIFSNTFLSLNGVTLNRGRSGINMLRTGEDEFAFVGVTGYHFRNITVEGGVFDGKSYSGTMLKIAHAKNYFMKGVRVQNNNNSHMMEVAGVDGFTVTGCSFLNQTLDKNSDGYEAIQLDVLYNTNLTNCRNEDLSMRNVLVEKCVFENCPRGVGSHTAVHNNPHNTLVIRNNTFRNMGSVAVQTLNWSNCSITGNTIDTAPRAIAVYSTLNTSAGTFLPSRIASSGDTEQHYPDTYQAQKSNVLIANNYINNCGEVNDIYASYEKAAISVIGAELTSSNQNGLPAGDYPCDTVTVKNNLMYVKGNGVRVEHSKTIKVDSNVIFGTGKNTSQNDYGIVFRNQVTAAEITKNYISNAPVNGMQIDNGNSVNLITGNEICTTGKYGIGAYSSAIGIIENNDIRDTADKGMSMIENTSVNTRISNNRVSGANNAGIHVTSDSYAKCISGNTTYNCASNIALNGTGSVGTNYTSSAALSSVKADAATVNLKVGECWRIGKTVSPVNAITTFSFSQTNGSVALLDKTGRITAKAAGTTVVTAKSANGKTATVTVNVTADPANVLGDIDGNGYVNANDYAFLAAHIANISDYNNANNADVTGDGVVNAKDRVVLARHLERMSGYEKLPKNVTGTAGASAQLTVSKSSAKAGDTVFLAVEMPENPGIATADFDVIYDDSALDLILVLNSGLIEGAAYAYSDQGSSPGHVSVFNDLAQTNSTLTGTLCLLVFKVSENAAGEYPVTIRQETGEIYNASLQSVPFTATAGSITALKDRPLGDVNGDYAVTIEDATLMQMVLAEYFDWDFDMEYADVNRDGRITIADVTAIQRILAEVDYIA